MDYRYIILIIAALCAFYYYTSRESFQDTTSKDTKASKECGKKSINEAYLTNIFGTPQFIR